MLTTSLRRAGVAFVVEATLFGILFSFGPDYDELPTPMNMALVIAGIGLVPLALGFLSWPPLTSLVPALLALVAATAFAEVAGGHYDMTWWGYLVGTTLFWGVPIAAFYATGFGVASGWSRYKARRLVLRH